MLPFFSRFLFISPRILLKKLCDTSPSIQSWSFWYPLNYSALARWHMVEGRSSRTTYGYPYVLLPNANCWSECARKLPRRCVSSCVQRGLRACSLTQHDADSAYCWPGTLLTQHGGVVTQHHADTAHCWLRMVLTQLSLHVGCLNWGMGSIPSYPFSTLTANLNP